jgi:hypothetical protein
LSDFQPGCKVAKLPCGHVFDAECITRWGARQGKCPLCRCAW